jgi:hypothetical protein
MLPAKVGYIWPSSFRGEDVLTLANQKQELLLAAIFLGQIKPNLAGNIYVRSPIMLLHLVPFGQKTWPPRAVLVSDWLRKKNCSWQPYLLAKRNETKKFYRGPYIDASCQVWLHLAKQFQRRRFFNSSQSEKRIALGGHVCWPNGTI